MLIPLKTVKNYQKGVASSGMLFHIACHECGPTSVLYDYDDDNNNNNNNNNIKQ
jgi:hypothetical protein